MPYRRGLRRDHDRPLALAYYRYARAVEDIGAFADDVFLSPAAGEPTKRAAVQFLISLFQPGSIVELAYEADRQASLG